MGKLRVKPSPHALDASLEDFATSLDRQVTNGTISLLGAGMSTSAYTRTLRGLDALMASLGRMRRVLETSRMLRDQLLGNTAPSAEAYIIADDIRINMARGDLPRSENVE